MRKCFAVLAVAMVFSVLAVQPAAAGIVGDGAATDIRTTAVLTTSDVLGTTFTAASLNVYSQARLTAVVAYVTLEKASLTNIIVSPAGAITGNPAAASYAIASPKAVTIATGGVHQIRFPVEEFGSQLMGIAVRGTGTVAGSGCTIAVKPEWSQ